MNKIISFKCPNCGGPLKFDPEKQKYACEYCLSQFTQQQAEEIKPDEASEQPQETEPAQPGAAFYTCPSCGAQVVTDETTAATFCYYCHNPVILTGKLSGEFNPDYVVPFAFDKDMAAGVFLNWMKKKKFVPKAFYSEDQIKMLSGVYFPYLMYSCRVNGQMNARADRLKIWVTGNYRYTETTVYDVRRTGEMEVKQVPRSALKKANRQLIEGVFPFELEKLCPFTMSYLSGFLAERRDMEQSEVSPEVKEEVRQFAENSLKGSIGTYDSVRVQSHSETLNDEKWEYALLPVWTLTYSDPGKDKMYYFTVNGQTGKVCGILPVDNGRLAVLFASVFFPLLFIMLILGYLI